MGHDTDELEAEEEWKEERKGTVDRNRMKYVV
jgi:hypothetical protein